MNACLYLLHAIITIRFLMPLEAYTSQPVWALLVGSAGDNPVSNKTVRNYDYIAKANNFIIAFSSFQSRFTLEIGTNVYVINHHGHGHALGRDSGIASSPTLKLLFLLCTVVRVFYNTPATTV